MPYPDDTAAAFSLRLGAVRRFDGGFGPTPFLASRRGATAIHHQRCFRNSRDALPGGRYLDMIGIVYDSKMSTLSHGWNVVQSNPWPAAAARTARQT
jgi:hypothetical protein